MSLEWSKEKTEALVSLYQQNQCLYDPSHYLYRDRNERKKTISYIATVLQTSENSITSKIKNIRSQLWRERWKEQYRELNGTEDRGKWWLKDSLQFLEPFLVLKPTTCCLQLDDGQAVPPEVSPGSESDRDFMQVNNIDFTHPNNVTRTELHPTVTRTDVNLSRTGLPSPPINPVGDHSGMKDLHHFDGQDQIPVEDNHQPIEFNHLEEIDKIKDDTDEILQGNSTEARTDPTRFISNYPTGIFRNDYVFDGRIPKGRVKHTGVRTQRNMEKVIDPARNITEASSQSFSDASRYSNSDLNNVSIEAQQRSKQFEHPPASGGIGSRLELSTHPAIYSEVSQRISATENSPSISRNRDFRTPQFNLRANSTKRVGKYRGKTDLNRHNKSKLAAKNIAGSLKRSWNSSGDEFDSNWNGGNLVVQTVSCLEKVSNRLAVEDQFTVFGKHVANELRSVTSLDAQRWARMKIQNILYEAQTFVNPSNSAHRSAGDIPQNRHSSTNNGTVQSTSMD